MNASGAFVTVGVVVGSAEAKRISSGQAPNFKPLIGGFMLGLFLLGLNEINTRIADLFAILIVVSAILVNGIPIFYK